MQFNRISYEVDGKVYTVKLDQDHRMMLKQLMERYQMPGASVIRLLIRTAAKKRAKKNAP